MPLSCDTFLKCEGGRPYAELAGTCICIQENLQQDVNLESELLMGHYQVNYSLRHCKSLHVLHLSLPPTFAIFLAFQENVPALLAILLSPVKEPQSGGMLAACR